MPLAACPNTPPCEHASAVHDRWDDDDPYPTCCVEGCRCGHPGEAVMKRHDDGTVTVEHADHLIKVSRDLLDSPHLEPWVKRAWYGVIQLDTAGHYRYRYLRPYREAGSGVDVYERVT